MLPIKPPPRKKHSKKLYPAGLLSLALLPLVFIWLLSCMGMFNSDKGVEFVIWPNRTEDSVFVKKELKKSYIKIDLTNDNTKNLATIKLAKNYLDELNQKYDTTKGIHLKFTDDLTHEAFVKIAELLNNERKFAYYQPMKNHIYTGYDIWAFNSIYPPSPPDTTDSMYRLCCVYSIEDPQPDKISIPNIVQFFTKYNFIFIAFFVLTISSITDIIRSIIKTINPA